MIRKAFRACYIYVRFENAGLWPISEDIVLEPLIEQEADRKEPLFPGRIQSIEMTPRRAKRKLQAVLETDIFNESITNVMKDVITALDVSIISQQAQNRIHKLTEERISREARRTKTRRQIQGVRDGALSMGQLRAKVKARVDEEYEDEAKQLTRAQEKMMRDIQMQEQ
jgi:hypothetical protein